MKLFAGDARASWDARMPPGFRDEAANCIPGNPLIPSRPHWWAPQAALFLWGAFACGSAPSVGHLRLAVAPEGVALGGHEVAEGDAVCGEVLLQLQADARARLAVAGHLDAELADGVDGAKRLLGDVGDQGAGASRVGDGGFAGPDVLADVEVELRAEGL